MVEQPEVPGQVTKLEPQTDPKTDATITKAQELMLDIMEAEDTGHTLYKLREAVQFLLTRYIVEA